MIVLTIGAYTNISKIKEYISLEFEKITPKALIPTYTIAKKGDIDFLYYEIDDDVLAQNYNFFFSDALKLHATSALTNLIMDFIRFEIVKEILEIHYQKYASIERIKILEMTRAFFYENENNEDPNAFNYSYRKEIMDRLMDFFEDSNEFLLEGFVLFRLKDYRGKLEMVVRHIVSEYETQKEYKEFLRLLKYFVDVQEMKEEIIHIIGLKEGGFKIYDKDKNDITERCKEEYKQDFSDKEINYDDLLVSALITIAPRQIVIHHYEAIQNKPLIETISSIFQGKVTLCPKCEFCLNSNEIN
ncbi:hypothetical protein GND95_09180 [Defluviitalea raffinosedens]|uniref:Sporulation protein YtxC n=1 Tax=Defluviitalea raffinosedens TaxID=1450156 RepID=A0A7C8LHA9_9FIRM|nr:hypothetical protein GND95_09180 [Defluviitalea raffinosedens]